MKMSELKSIRIQPEIDLTYIQNFVAKEVLPGIQERDEKGEFSLEIAKGMHREGILRVITPKEFGGPELPVADLIWVTRTLAQGSAGVAATFIGNLLGYSAMVIYGKPALRKMICTRFERQYGLWSFGMTEKGCGSDLEKTATKAVKTKDGYILNGEKNFITNATYATDISLFAHLYDENGNSLGISCFYIPGDTPGLTRGAGEKKMGWRESNTGHLFLNNVLIPHDYLLGAEGDGLRILTHCLNRSKTLLGAVSVGICDRALELTTTRLASTQRFDRALIDKHSIRHVLSRLSVKIECAWLLAANAAATWDHQAYAIKEASMAKLYGGETATEVTGKCVELFGARGYLSDFEIQRLYRDAKAIEIVEGPTLVQELLISKFVIQKSTQAPKKKDLYDPKAAEKKAAS
jgi:alkylation response protein AidB-like acyl-CoA dehydrogenase